MSRVVVVCVSDPADRRCAQASLRNQYEVRFVSDVSQLRALAGADYVDGIVFEPPHGDAERAIRMLLVAMRTGERPTPLLVRSALDREAILWLQRFSRERLVPPVSLRGAGEFGSDITQIVLRRVRQPAITAILERFLSFTPTRVAGILVGAAAVGRRKAHVAYLARLCELPVRTLEWRLASCGMPTARQLLSRMLLLHAAWNLEYTGLPIKHIADGHGFDTRAAFANFFKRAAGVTPGEFRDGGNFAVLVEHSFDNVNWLNDAPKLTTRRQLRIP